MVNEIDRSDIVVIGGVAAGPKTAAVLARRLPGHKITLFQKESRISYGTCGLPYFASGDINSFDELTYTSYSVPRTPDFFLNSKNFEVRVLSEVLNINRSQKTVTVKNIVSNDIFVQGYGKLVIATGSVPNRPPFPYPTSPVVRSFTRPEDAIHFRQMVQTGQIEKVVIIGGGFIGCELVEAMASMWGIETVLVEKEPQVLPFVLDREMAELVKHEMVKKEITVMTGAEVEKVGISQDNRPEVHIKNQAVLSADYVFICVGVHPESSLAKECGLKIGSTGGIEVNSRLQTSDPDIYAGGDCVEVKHLITGGKIFLPMGSLANRHGWVIAENICGNEREFPGVVGSFLVKVFDLNVGITGLSEQTAARDGLDTGSVLGSFPDKPDYYPEVKTFTIKLVYEKKSGRLLGLQAVGEGDICRRVDVFSAFLQRKAAVEDLLHFEHGYAPPYSEALDPLHQLATMVIAQQGGTSFLKPAFDFDGFMEHNGLTDVIALDVREPEEIEAHPWRIAGRNNVQHVNIPLNDLKKRLDELVRTREIVIMCRRGPRAYQASVILKQAGFHKVHVIGGGAQASLL